MITIVLAENHQLVRLGIKALLQVEPEFHIVGEAGDGLQTCQVVRELKPNVLLVGSRMPSLSGLEVARQVLRHLKGLRVLILGTSGDDIHVLEALRSGVAGYVLWDSTALDLVEAVREVSAGRHYLCESLSKRVLEALSQGAAALTPDQHEVLTSRERQVLHLIAEGRTNAEAGRRLSISRRTVELHRANMMRKLGLKNQTEVIRYAIRQRILPDE